MVTSSTFGYTLYRMTATIVPLAALAVSLVGTVIMVYAIILLCWPFRRMMEYCAHKSCVRKCLAQLESEKGKLPCWTCIFGGLKLVYGNEVDELEAKGKPTIYSICGRHVRPWLLAVLFLVVMFVCSCTIIAFWNAFLVDESNHCTSNMDCFAINSTTGYSITEDPLVNCSQYEQNYKIHCFRFIFDYASALGNAGGVLVLASVTMNVQAGLWVGASSQQGKICWYAGVITVTLLNTICAIGLIALPVMVHTIPLLTQTVVGTNRAQIQFFTYWSTFMCAFIFSGPILMVFSRRLKRETAFFGEEQYVSTANSRGVSVNSRGGSVLSTRGRNGTEPESELQHLTPKTAHHNYQLV